ncbi:MAG: hypothetical protein IT460_08025 [Planctomycetes bacterium]|nr:hypothetical protein [Planctomycetota bacterium]
MSKVFLRRTRSVSEPSLLRPHGPGCGEASSAKSLVGAALLALAACGGGPGGDSTGPINPAFREHRLSEARAEHALTTLGNGDLLVTGGIGLSGARLTSCDVIDASVVPTGDPVVATGAMAVARARHTATLLGSGRVVVIGGSSVGATEEYVPSPGNPAAGTFTASATAVLSTPRARHAAVALLDGRVLVVGGEDAVGAALGSCELYVSAAAPMAAAGPLGTARRDATATRLPDGRVLVVGGRDAAGAVLASAEVYDPGTNAWTTLASTLSTPRALHAALLLGGDTPSPADDRVVVTGGFGPLGLGVSSVEQLDPATLTFSPAGDLDGPGVFDHAAVVLGNGQGAVLGGFSSGGASASAAPVRETAVYRLASGTGVGAQDLPGRRGATRAGVVASSGPAGSDVVLVGGYAEDGTPQDEVFVLPLDDEATALADTLTDEEALALGVFTTAFHLFYDGLVGGGDVDLVVERDPVFGTRVRGWVGNFDVDLEVDAGSVVGEVEGKDYKMSVTSGLVRAPDLQVDYRPFAYVDGDMDVAEQDFDFDVDRDPGLFRGWVYGFDTEAALRIDVDFDHTDPLSSYLDVYWIY